MTGERVWQRGSSFHHPSAARYEQAPITNGDEADWWSSATSCNWLRGPKKGCSERMAAVVERTSVHASVDWPRDMLAWSIWEQPWASSRETQRAQLPGTSIPHWASCAAIWTQAYGLASPPRSRNIEEARSMRRTKLTPHHRQNNSQRLGRESSSAAARDLCLPRYLSPSTRVRNPKAQDHLTHRDSEVAP